MKIQISNQSTVVSDSDVASWIPDLQAQLDNEFQAAWGARADLSIVVGALDSGQPSCIILDNSDAQGALGYHDVDPNTDIPFIRVFAVDSQQAGVSISSVMSHEICEMVADPLVDSTVVVDLGSGLAQIFIVEDCDPVEADSYKGLSGNTDLSNFVFPEWFDPNTPNGVQTDQMGTTAGPLQLSSGGYISFRYALLLGDWQQIFGDKARTKGTSSRKRGLTHD